MLAREPRDSPEALIARLTEFRSRGITILECIVYVKLNQGCSLAEAKDIVINSRVWADQKDMFLRHQQEMFEEFLADNKDKIEAIHQTIIPNGTDLVVRMKPPISPDKDTAEPSSAVDSGGM